jgi:uncharacterized membrane protein YfcA
LLDVVDALVRLGVGGLLGFLFGVGAVWWVDPHTGAGVAVLLIIFVVLGMMLGRLFPKNRGKADDDK